MGQQRSGCHKKVSGKRSLDEVKDPNLKREIFAATLRQNTTPDEIETEFSQAIHIVERELHVMIDADYPLMKFLNQIEMIKWYKEEERKANNQ